MKTYKYLWLILLVFAFTTCKEDEPAPIASIEIKDVVIEAAYTTADIQWNITCNASMQEVILEYSTDSAFKNLQQVPMQKVHKETDDGLYQVTISSLTEETKYYARSRVVNKINSYASAAQVFETNAYRLPHVSTDSITNITVSSATLHATLLDWGTDTLPQVGFCVATHTDVSIADSSAIYYLQTMNDTIPYSFTLKNLTDNVTYYVRAFARNTKGVAYGKEMSFSTAKIFLPSVGETTISNITYTTAVCTSEILSDGGSEVIERGICYATTQNPTTANYKVASGSGIGSFSCNLTDLASATTYYVRAYAINSKGTSYGEPVLFTTVAYGLPTITTSAVTNITYTSATCGGDVTSDGGQTVTERGVCYATTQNPTISNTKISSGSGSGSFSCNLTGLNEGTKYYVRAYATNSQGTSYSEEIAFTTTAYQKPTVTTSPVTNITYTSATCGGNVTADGGQTVTERGVCYATTQNPTISDTKVISGSGTGAFSCEIQGLSLYVKYYVRAYAINSKGVAYGEEMSFTTFEDNPNTIIRYSAPQKLQETTNGNSDGLHVDRFGDASIVLHDYNNGEGFIVFSQTLSTIGVRAFAGCSELTSITIPKSVTIIGGSAFRDCSNLTNIELPNSVTSIGGSAFRDCSNLTNIELPNSVTSIGEWAFYGCSSLNSIKIPNSVTSIHWNPFPNCSSLTSIVVENGNAVYDSRNNCNAIIATASNTLTAGCKQTFIPNSVTSIGESAFWDCTGLKEITIPNSVTSIEDNAFKGCSNLTNIELPNSVTSIGEDAFYNCESMKSVAIPNSVTSIERTVFYGCKSLKSIIIPNSVTSIGYGAFYVCTSLTSIDIPNSVTSIGQDAFRSCSGLTRLTISNSIKSIGGCAFYGCSSLTFIRCEAAKPPSVGSSVFKYVEKSIPVYVPAASVSAYQSANGWCEFTNILPINE